MAFYEQKAPDATFRFPHGFDAFRNASDTAKFDAIAQATGCKLIPEAVHGAMGVKIYGTRDQFADAIGQLRAWSLARDKAINRKTSAFPHIGPYNAIKDDTALRKAKSAERRKRFCADPEAIDRKKFNHAIILEYKRCEWMDNDKILGAFMEALDPIRMHHKCHIIYMKALPIPDLENGDKDGCRIGQGFFLCGKKKELMEQAVERLKNLDKQITGHQIEAPEFFLVKPVAFPLDYNAHAIQRKAYQANSDIDEKNFQTMHLKNVSGSKPHFLSTQEADIRSVAELDVGAILMGNRHTTSLNIQYIDMWLTAMLERLHCWQGYLEMRVSVGTCAFKKFPTAREFSLHEFEEMVEDRNSDADSDGLEAFMTTELGDYQTESVLLKRFLGAGLGAGHSLICVDHLPGRAVYPQCTAIFNMKSPWNSTEILRLKAVFKENGFGDFLLNTHQWEILEGDKNHAKQMVDIKLVDLNHSRSSNAISVVAGTFVTDSQKAKLPGWSLYERFLKKISVIPENTKSSVKDRPIFDFEENNGKGGIYLLSLEQRKSYMFEISKGPGRGYHAELFSFQTPDLRKKTHFPQDTRFPQKEQRWGVQLWHPSWDTLFYDHRYLDIGMQADWEPAEWQFFPPASEHINDWQDVQGMEFEVGSGYKNMLDAVRVVEMVIHGKKEPVPVPVLPAANKKEFSKDLTVFNQHPNNNGARFPIPDKTLVHGSPDTEQDHVLETVIRNEEAPIPETGKNKKQHGKGLKMFNRRLNGNGARFSMPDKTPVVRDGPDAQGEEDLIGVEKKTQRREQSRYQAPAVTAAQSTLTGNALDLVGLEVIPVDKEKLTGAARDLAGLFM
ncbi:hypothetical protein BLS_001259 [Venturia inaequalis]|uniref:DUF7905 domain-containing protein n=1 Tax=Venturia inaequalis TaxID=5025 RepID=A0A8H3U219_VENIN|nr:hypothetical protein BLS_001259 [Venturia inaequalis]KAE9976189.1 hypothetical protein EG328_002741 [Venturia inaequalis]